MNSAPAVAATSKPQKARRSRKSFNRFMRITRRTHMYLGLALVPWVLLFGISGFLFNHESSFWGGNRTHVADFSADEISAALNLAPLDLRQAMDTALRRINEASAAKGGPEYHLEGEPWLNGHLKLEGRHDHQTLALSIDLADATATLESVAGRNATVERPAFSGAVARLDSVDPGAIAATLPALVSTAGITLQKPLALPARGSNAELRFRLSDADGRLWNGTLNLATGALDGRAADVSSGMNFRDTVTRLHKTHHYPDQVNARFVWNVIGDITALSLVIWGLSGLVMWWQIQPSRVIGSVAILIASVAAFVIFAGTIDDHTHNPPALRARP